MHGLPDAPAMMGSRRRTSGLRHRGARVPGDRGRAPIGLGMEKTLRKVIRLVVIVLLFGLHAGSTSADSAGLAEPLYIVEFATGPAWVAEKPFHEQAHAAAHSANLRRLRDRGVLVLGARHGAKGMIVIRMSSRAAAQSEIDQDPAVGAGVFSYTIEEFKPFYSGCVETPTSSRSTQR